MSELRLDAIRTAIRGSSEKELLRVASQFARSNNEEEGISGPKNPDELHDYIRTVYGLNIPRVAVCEGHDAPFDYVCSAYFYSEEHETGEDSLFGMASRGGGKSALTALVHHLSARFRPGYQGATFGAVQEQAQRVYDSFRNFLNAGLDKDSPSETIGEPRISRTQFKNGSQVEVLGSTVKQVNGPHPNTAHADEVEIMESAPWSESRNMAQDTIINGRRLRAKNIATSTRKYKNGRVDKLYQQFREAIVQGKRPIFQFKIWCLVECAQEMPDCQMTTESERRTRLLELQRDPCELCDCDKIENGSFDDNSSRTFDKVCRGRFFRSRGYRSHGEIIGLFMQNDRATWEAQQECSEAESAGLYLPTFSTATHGISNFPVHPSNGPIFTGTDWGFEAAGTVLWIQILARPVPCVDYQTGEARMLPSGSHIAFGELYKIRKTDTELGQLAKAKELEWALQAGIDVFPVRRRWADLQGASGRMDWIKLGLKTNKYDRDFETQIKNLRPLFEQGKFFVDVDSCPIFCEEIQSWRKGEDGKEVREFNHIMSSLRYCCQGIHEIRRRDGDSFIQVGPDIPVTEAPIADSYVKDEREIDEEELSWRPSLSPFTGGFLR